MERLHGNCSSAVYLTVYAGYIIFLSYVWVHCFLATISKAYQRPCLPIEIQQMALTHCYSGKGPGFQVKHGQEHTKDSAVVPSPGRHMGLVTMQIPGECREETREEEERN